VEVRPTCETLDRPECTSWVVRRVGWVRRGRQAFRKQRQLQCVELSPKIGFIAAGLRSSRLGCFWLTPDEDICRVLPCECHMGIPAPARDRFAGVLSSCLHLISPPAIPSVPIDTVMLALPV
jgi:hypothetical protein